MDAKLPQGQTLGIDMRRVFWMTFNVAIVRNCARHGITQESKYCERPIEVKLQVRQKMAPKHSPLVEGRSLNGDQLIP